MPGIEYPGAAMCQARGDRQALEVYADEASVRFLAEEIQVKVSAITAVFGVHNVNKQLRITASKRLAASAVRLRALPATAAVLAAPVRVPFQMRNYLKVYPGRWWETSR